MSAPSRPPPSTTFLERKGAGTPCADAEECNSTTAVEVYPTCQDLKLVRHYLIWPTKNRFCCAGHLMTGPEEDIGPNFCAWGLILTPMGLFLYTWGPAVIARSIVHFTLTLACFASTICWFVVTSFTDPGILKRAHSAQFQDTKPQFKEPSIKNETERDGTMVTYTWCHTCHIYRPPRASHCSDCDNCVREFDHHCPFTRNCIGARNYPYFLLFLISTCLSLADVGFSCLLLPPEEMVSTIASRGVNLSPLINAVLVGFSALILLFLLAFTGYHLSLVLTGLTTKEHLKGRFNPQAKGLCARAIRCVGCSGSPSELEPRRLVQPVRDPYTGLL